MDVVGCCWMSLDVVGCHCLLLRTTVAGVDYQLQWLTSATISFVMPAPTTSTSMHTHSLPEQSTDDVSHAVLVQVTVVDVGFLPTGHFTAHVVGGLPSTGTILHAASTSEAPLFNVGSTVHSSAAGMELSQSCQKGKKLWQEHTSTKLSTKRSKLPTKHNKAPTKHNKWHKTKKLCAMRGCPMECRQLLHVCVGRNMYAAGHHGVKRHQKT